MGYQKKRRGNCSGVSINLTYERKTDVVVIRADNATNYVTKVGR